MPVRMTGDYLELALQNLRRNPRLSGLAVLAIGVGIGTSMSVYSVLHAMSREPAPERSWRLHAPGTELMPRPHTS
jgi:putative ABC transport system permease protein